MSILLHGDCLELMKTLDDDSIDLIFCDLPYGQTSCKWDCPIDLDLFWLEVMRIKKLHTPIFMTTTTKFGVSLINSAPKKCHFRYDIVWVKSAPAGFLSAKKMPMRKHEMIYVFYEKLPFYDLSSHTHKFIKERDTAQKNGAIYEGNGNKKIMEGKYDPPLPVSIVKEESGGATMDTLYGEIKIKELDKPRKDRTSAYDPPLPVSIVKEPEPEQDNNKDFSVEVKNSTYGTLQIKQPVTSGPRWDPPLPVSVVKEESAHDTIYGKIEIKNPPQRKNGESRYDPPLPTSIVKETIFQSDSLYGKEEKKIRYKNSEGKITSETNGKRYDPPLPVSVVKEETGGATGTERKIKDNNSNKGGLYCKINRLEDIKYDPPLPTSMLEIKSTRGKHSTEKPVALMEWILKYYSKEGDVVLDPTMGSGSTGVACKNMNRNFIGIEKDPEIYEGAVNRIEG